MNKNLFPYADPLGWQNESYDVADILSALSSQVTPERLQKMQKVISGRTYAVTAVLEHVDDIGNMNAVLRTSESLGFQEVHLIAGGKVRRCARVTQGCEKWMDVKKWQETAPCLDYLKQRGRKVYVSTLDAKAKPIHEIDFSVPCAVVFGNEKEGVSTEMGKACDETFFIPMLGFSQSFNISVAAALTLQFIYLERVKKAGKQGDLSSEEERLLLAHFLMRATTHPEQIIKRFLSKN